ncbi:hypothetical protein [Halotalea alkalilenta]|uniref:Uncharacterized protein n=1 Tax=Halotalea alkalilenta TaxID=376489 RepID=A0A172YEA3_9GAMM|nr:hypothetical protein [Halotalea alkalilenta]ANF57422.1 hypothetical protein A5892_08050 [Halotalea alkalilenta]
MSMQSLPRSSADVAADGLLGPGADPLFRDLVSSSMRWQAGLAHLEHRIRSLSQRWVSGPMERLLLRHWRDRGRWTPAIERMGLPRRAMQAALGEAALTLYVDPRKLIRIVKHAPREQEPRPSSKVFIWDGNWDLGREDLREGSRYRFISDLELHRDELRESESYRRLYADLAQGEPRRFRQLGICLDSEERIEGYLRVYLAFLDGMAAGGFDASRGKDRLGVAVSREGKLLKINRGLHRLAMAQSIGLPLVPVFVQSVHRQWWQQVVGQRHGEQALAALRSALQSCVPEEAPGPLDRGPSGAFDDRLLPSSRSEEALIAPPPVPDGKVAEKCPGGNRTGAARSEECSLL